MGRGPKAYNLRPEHHHAVIPVLGFVIQCDLNRHSLLGSGLRHHAGPGRGEALEPGAPAHCVSSIAKFNTLEERQKEGED